MKHHASRKREQRGVSVVIATIMLVGVTVALASVVSLWMGALTLNSQKTENLYVTQVTLASNVATFYVSNRGTTDVRIAHVQASGLGISSTANSFATTGSNLISKGSSSTLSITVGFQNGQTTFATGYQYSFVLVTTQGNLFPAVTYA